MHAGCDDFRRQRHACKQTTQQVHTSARDGGQGQSQMPLTRKHISQSHASARGHRTPSLQDSRLSLTRYPSGCESDHGLPRSRRGPRPGHRRMRAGGSGNCARCLLSGGGSGGGVRGGGGPIQRLLHRLRRRQLLVGAPLGFAKRIFGSGGRPEGGREGGVGCMSVRTTQFIYNQSLYGQFPPRSPVTDDGIIAALNLEYLPLNIHTSTEIKTGRYTRGDDGDTYRHVSNWNFSRIRI